MIVGLFPATTMPDADWWQALWPDPVTVLVEMGVRPGMVVVDLCCGDGLFTAPLARIVDSVYAIDIDPAMLDLACTRAGCFVSLTAIFEQTASPKARSEPMRLRAAAPIAYASLSGISVRLAPYP